jgi:hypothetical protein
MYEEIFRLAEIAAFNLGKPAYIYSCGDEAKLVVSGIKYPEGKPGYTLLQEVLEGEPPRVSVHLTPIE